MTPVPDFQLSFALCLTFILLVPFAIAGLALINTGLGRSRSAAHAMVSAVSVLGIAVVVYLIWGFAIQGYSPFADKFFVFTEEGPPGLFLRGVSVPGAWLYALIGLLDVVLAAQIPIGAAADRWKLSAVCASTAVFAGWTYPLFARFAQTWLLALGARLSMGSGFLDAGGSGFINVTGGLTALAITWLLGPRRGKYSPNGMPAAIPAHNAVYVLFGCMLAWVGWLGLNSAGAILYASSPPERSVLVIINTTFCAAAAGLTAAAVTRIRFRRPDASLIANGWMAGLVASSAGCAILKPATAILTGLVAGALVVFSVEFFEFTLKVDDPCGSISVHAVCGIWGLLAAGIFAGSSGQLMAQIVGVATLLGFIFPMAYGLNWVLNKIIPYRVSPDAERQGLDLHELGADAYPEFVVHADEFMQR
jgi:Amt family ammonium transporter